MLFTIFFGVSNILNFAKRSTEITTVFKVSSAVAIATAYSVYRLYIIEFILWSIIYSVYTPYILLITVFDQGSEPKLCALCQNIAAEDAEESLQRLRKIDVCDDDSRAVQCAC